MSVLGGNLLAMGGIATALRGGGSPSRKRVCYFNARRSFAGCSAVDLRGGGPLYAGGGRTPRKGGLVLASATSFPPFSQSCRAVDSQSLISLSLLSRYIRYYIRYPHGILVLGSASRDLAFATQARGGKR